MFDFKALEAQLRTNVDINPNMCSCSNCGWNGKTEGLETSWESEGWEYPDYQIDLCPVCPDGGCIDDYYYTENEAIMRDIVEIIQGD